MKLPESLRLLQVCKPNMRVLHRTCFGATVPTWSRFAAPLVIAKNRINSDSTWPCVQLELERIAFSVKCLLLLEHAMSLNLLIFL